MAEAARAGDARRLAGQRRLVEFASTHVSQPTLLNFFQRPAGAGQKRGREDGFETDEEAEEEAEAEEVEMEEVEVEAAEAVGGEAKTPQEKYEAVWALFEPSLALRLGQFAQFRALQQELASQGLRACSSLICPHGVRSVEDFGSHPTNKDGIRPTCKACVSREGWIAASAAMEARKALVNARMAAAHETGVTHEKYREVRALFEATFGLRFGQFLPFKALQEELAPTGLRPCSSLTCPFGVRGVEHFRKDKAESCCKACSDGEGRTARNAAFEARRNILAARVVAKNPVRNASAVEDEAAVWLKAWLEIQWPQLIVEILPEFRHADIAVRLAHWVGDDGEDLWLPIQLKSNGIFKKDGVTLQPNDSTVDGRAMFSYCTGYNGLLMVFVKTRRDVDGSDVRRLWSCWGDEVGRDCIHEGMNDGKDGRSRHTRSRGLLRVSDTQHVAPVDLAAPMDLWAMMTSKPELRRPWVSLWMEIGMKKQRKEVAMMLAMDQISEVVIAPGNQTAVDCTWNGLATQVKTIKRTGCASTCHNKNGVQWQPYSDTDGIEQLVECLIVESDGDYYLMHAVQPLDALVEHGVFATDGNVGRAAITVTWGCYAEWITGAPVSRVQKRNAWLQGPTYGWRTPFKLTPNSYLTTRLLAEVAHVAANPAAMPEESV